jgi:hypothetical protein
MAMPERFLILETQLRRRGRRWTWFLFTADGRLIMQSSESRRSAARYQANRALFQMMLRAPGNTYRRGGAGTSQHRSGRSRSEN